MNEMDTKKYRNKGHKQTCLLELNDKGLLKGETETSILFQEQDCVWLSIQGKDIAMGKSKKKELKLAVSYTG